jgi:putative membrane-bound dehydrogenase-like protein
MCGENLPTLIFSYHHVISIPSHSIIHRFLAIVWFFASWASPTFAGEPVPPNNQEITNIPFTPPEKAVKLMRLPPQFKATLFAAEPQVQNPIAMCWDERGRLWIAENYTYSDAAERFNLELKDRILIFEDEDNDGCFDKRTVFAENLQRLTSIERGFGGVYALCPPQLLFIPTTNDLPSGPPQIILDGFNADTGLRHCLANGLKWGPDGWLYGRIGITSTSWIGVHGTSKNDRQPTAGGIWRYHPTRKIYEPYCHGTTNPWGMDWNENGELFFINTVIGHLWHGIPGAHFKRMMGQDLVPHTYELIDQHADHYHWDTGKNWTETRDGVGLTDSLGGGHAHVGFMIYQGSNFPPEYRGKAFMTNLHGRRINTDRLEPSGSGYVGRHGPDFMKSDDPWFRPVEISYGPDGGVYILDWSDVGECHENDGVHRTSGRIYKITYGDPIKPTESDLSRVDEQTLINLQLSENEWLVRMARWELRERQFRGTLSASSFQAIKRLGPLDLRQQQNVWRTLKWLDQFPTDEVIKELVDPTSAPKHVSTTLASAKITLSLLEQSPETLARLFSKGSSNYQALLDLTKNEPSAAMRLKWASLLQRLPSEARLQAARGLISHAEDTTDHNMPMMVWYGICELPSSELVKLIDDCKIPRIRQFITRRAAEEIESAPEVLDQILTSSQMDHTQDILLGMKEALKGWSKTKKPTAWDTFVKKSTRPSDADPLRALSVLFGDPQALEQTRALVLDSKNPLETRRASLRQLIDAKAPDIQLLCETLLADDTLRLGAVQGLANFDNPALAEKIITTYSSFPPHERPDVIAALASQPSFAKILLANLNTRIPRGDLSPLVARQIRSFKNPELTQKLAEVWGEARESSNDKKNLIARLKSKLSPEFIAKGNLRDGRRIYATSCGACHKLYGEGASIGPDLTGSGRHDVDYLIENIADPSATVAADYMLTVITLKDGRVVNGTIREKTDRTLTINAMGSEITVERLDIAQQQQLAVSMMPEGLLNAMDDKSLADLISYLMSSEQVAE